MTFSVTSSNGQHLVSDDPRGFSMRCPHGRPLQRRLTRHNDREKYFSGLDPDLGGMTSTPMAHDLAGVLRHKGSPRSPDTCRPRCFFRINRAALSLSVIPCALATYGDCCRGRPRRRSMVQRHSDRTKNVTSCTAHSNCRHFEDRPARLSIAQAICISASRQAHGALLVSLSVCCVSYLGTP